MDTHPTMLEMYEGSVLDGLPHLSYANIFPPMQLCDWLAVINILPACDFVILELLCQQAALKRDFVNVWCLVKWCSVYMYVCPSLFSKWIQIWAVGDTIPCWYQIEEEVFSEYDCNKILHMNTQFVLSL